MSIAKVIVTDLQADVTGTYDPDKTTIAGNIQANTHQSTPVLSSALTKWYDVFSDSGETILYTKETENNRLFGIAANFRVVYATRNPISGAFVYVGKIQGSFPAGTNTIRGFNVDDANTADIKIAVATLNSTTASLSGCVLFNEIDLSDFVPVSFPTIPYGLGNDQKACYKLDDPAFIGINALNTVPDGIDIDKVNDVIYIPNGLAATHTIFKYSYGTGPTWSAQTCTAPTVISSPTFTLTNHGYTNLDQVVIVTNAPGGFTLTTSGAQTAYFIRNATANTFELSATSGGAVINATTATTPDVGRAHGNTGSNFVEKTGQLSPNPFTGTILLTDSVRVFTPQHGANSGQPCLMIGCSTSNFSARLSDITSGVTTLPTALSINLLGATNEVTAPTATHMCWDSTYDRFVYAISSAKFVAKKLVNNILEETFGALNNTYLEGISQTNLVTQFGAVTITGLEAVSGWTIITCGTTGQRGIIAMQSGADKSLGTTYIITKVLDIDTALSFIGVASSVKDAERTNGVSFEYRTNLTTDFSVATGGWTAISSDNLLTAVSPVGVNQVQLKLLENTIDLLNSNPAQIIDAFFAYVPLNQMSEYWKGMASGSNDDSPSHVVYRQVKLYGGPAPTLYHRGVDDSGNVVESFNTVTHVAQVTHSLDDGQTWNAGVGSDTLYKRLRFQRTTPPTVTVTNSLKEF